MYVQQSLLAQWLQEIYITLPRWGILRSIHKNRRHSLIIGKGGRIKQVKEAIEAAALIGNKVKSKQVDKDIFIIYNQTHTSFKKSLFKVN